MYGVPADLDLAMFVATRLNRIGLAKFQLQLYFGKDAAPFDPGVYLSVEGYWELWSADGELVDHGPNGARTGTEPVTQAAFRAHALVSQMVIGFELASPESFTLVFDDGQRLRVFDDSDRYESVSIQPGNIFI